MDGRRGHEAQVLPTTPMPIANRTIRPAIVKPTSSAPTVNLVCVMVEFSPSHPSDLRNSPRRAIPRPRFHSVRVRLRVPPSRHGSDREGDGRTPCRDRCRGLRGDSLSPGAGRPSTGRRRAGRGPEGRPRAGDTRESDAGSRPPRGEARCARAGDSGGGTRTPLQAAGVEAECRSGETATALAVAATSTSLAASSVASSVAASAASDATATATATVTASTASAAATATAGDSDEAGQRQRRQESRSHRPAGKVAFARLRDRALAAQVMWRVVRREVTFAQVLSWLIALAGGAAALYWASLLVLTDHEQRAMLVGAGGLALVLWVAIHLTDGNRPSAR